MAKDLTKDGWEEVQTGNDSVWDRKEAIQGLLIDKRENVGPNNSMFYTIEKADGERVGIWGSTVLDTRLKNCEAGKEEVHIECLGEAKSEKTGRTYTDYKVFHRPAQFKEVKQDVEPPEGMSEEEMEAEVAKEEAK